MITPHTDRLEISLPVAAALLAFAAKDDTRPHLCCIAISDGALCATDGHRAVMFGFTDGTSIAHGKAWPRQHVETRIAIAKATKAKSIDLAFAECTDVVVPPYNQVMPQDGLKTGRTDFIGVNPAYLGDLEKVRKACDATGVKLTSLGGSLDPIGFTVDGGYRGGLLARVAIMPMRI
jgi:hypothetical protein